MPRIVLMWPRLSAAISADRFVVTPRRAVTRENSRMLSTPAIPRAPASSPRRGRWGGGGGVRGPILGNGGGGGVNPLWGGWGVLGAAGEGVLEVDRLLGG